MGWDLHPIIEMHIDGKWMPLSMTLSQFGNRIMYNPEDHSVFVERNHLLHYMLSGSDSYMAEMKYPEQFKTIQHISETSRGIPDDCSNIVKEYMEYIINTYENHTNPESDYSIDTSWVLLSELESYPDRSITNNMISEIRQKISYSSDEYLKVGSNDIRIIFYYDH